MVERKLHKIDASGKILGRLASEIAILLRGKNKPEFQPNMDMGDVVEVSNIGQIKLSGKKIEQKKYFRYSGYPGGLKAKTLKDLMASKPGEALKEAVRDMLPPVKFRGDMLKRLLIK